MKQFAEMAVRDSAATTESTSSLSNGSAQNDSRAQDHEALDVSPEFRRKMLRKIDTRVLPCLSILFFLAFLDKVNIGNAATLGMTEDLNLTGTRLNTALTIFFVPYVILEIPANILMKICKPHIWFSICTISFGIVSMCQGFVHNYGSLVVVRFFLGVAECGTFPGCFYLISMWYTKLESQKRFTAFYQSITIAGAFGGLLAAAIGLMDGVGGYAGWRWIFILEGIVTIIVGVIFYWAVSDFPETATWLQAEERDYVLAHLRAAEGSSQASRPICKADFQIFLGDWKNWISMFAYFSLLIPAYGYAYFAPTIIKGLGYSPIETQLHSVPPWACTLGLSIALAVLSDRLRHRTAFAILPAFLAVAGLGMLLGIHHHIRAQYAALFLTVMGTWACLPIVIGWFTMNQDGHHQRAIATAWQIGFGNSAGIPAVFLFTKSQAPRYTTGFSIALAFLLLGMILNTAYCIGCYVSNRSLKKSEGVEKSSEGPQKRKYIL